MLTIGFPERFPVFVGLRSSSPSALKWKNNTIVFLIYHLYICNKLQTKSRIVIYSGLTESQRSGWCNELIWRSYYNGITNCILLKYNKSAQKKEFFFEKLHRKKNQRPRSNEEIPFYLLSILGVLASLIVKVKIIIRATLKKWANRLAKDDKRLVILRKQSHKIEMCNHYWNPDSGNLDCQRKIWRKRSKKMYIYEQDVPSSSFWQIALHMLLSLRMFCQVLITWWSPSSLFERMLVR